MALPSGRPRTARKSSSLSEGRASTSLQKTKVLINVYDLLPPGKLSSFLWTIGTGLLHSGVVIGDKEYAFGGHNKRGVTGVYWTRPRYEPPGGTHRLELLQGFSFRSKQEIEAIIKEVSDEFLGRDYNLLSKNCNHFTNALCVRLTSKSAPGWLNRAAGIGLAVPCMVPREWITPPDHETADGELLEDEYEEDENAAMLAGEWRRSREEQAQEISVTAAKNGSAHSLAGGNRIISTDGSPPPRPVSIKDTSGRELPPAERAPVPRKP